MKKLTREQFERFHGRNPHIFELFVRFAREQLDAGRKYYSIRAIEERIRRETRVVTEDEDGFKLNTNFNAFYSRMIMETYPEFKDFFRTKGSVADQKS